MEELGLVIRALWQDLGYQEARRGALEEDLRAGMTPCSLTCRM